MCYFLENYGPKVHNSLKSSLVLLLIQSCPFSKRKHKKGSCFGAKYIEAGCFFLFQAVIGYISSSHGVCYIKNIEHRSQWPAA